jgi:Transposase DDE domain
LLRLIDLDWAVPNFSTLSRRQKTLKVNIPYRGSAGPLHLLIDIEPVSATGSNEPARGIKVEGEGEWNARKHGGSKRRVWRKIHIGIDEQTLEIRAAEFTISDVGDVEPVSATGSSEPARHAARPARPDPARSGDRQRHRRWRLRHPQVPPLRGLTRPHQGPRSPFAPSPPEALPRSFRPARTPSRGSPTQRGQ